MNLHHLISIYLFPILGLLLFTLFIAILGTIVFLAVSKLMAQQKISFFRSYLAIYFAFLGSAIFHSIIKYLLLKTEPSSSLMSLLLGAVILVILHSLAVNRLLKTDPIKTVLISFIVVLIYVPISFIIFFWVVHRF